MIKCGRAASKLGVASVELFAISGKTEVSEPFLGLHRLTIEVLVTKVKL
tara:strand:+ start:1324 stop:1470 length:147 start_codon:yes stop_codon:yes gene_type:complete